MIYTEEVFVIEDKLLALGKKIKESQTMADFIEKRLELLTCQESQQKVASFNLAKESFERIESFGEFAPDYKEKRRALRKEKRMVDTDEKVMAYRFAERDLQETLDMVSYRVAQSISEDIKIDAGNPFFEFAQRGCGGSCHVS